MRAGRVFWMEGMGPAVRVLVCFFEPYKNNRSLCLMCGVDGGGGKG